MEMVVVSVMKQYEMKMVIISVTKQDDIQYQDVLMKIAVITCLRFKISK